MEKDLKPLVLRLIKVRLGGKKKAYLLTSVLDEQALTTKEALSLYEQRWGVELEFRALKQTFERRTLRSRKSERALVEMEWSLFGMTVIELFALHEQLQAKRADPQAFSRGVVGAEAEVGMHDVLIDEVQSTNVEFDSAHGRKLKGRKSNRTSKHREAMMRRSFAQQPRLRRFLLPGNGQCLVGQCPIGETADGHTPEPVAFIDDGRIEAACSQVRDVVVGVRAHHADGALIAALHAKPRVNPVEARKFGDAQLLGAFLGFDPGFPQQEVGERRQLFQARPQHFAPLTKCRRRDARQRGRRAGVQQFGPRRQGDDA